MDSRLKLKIVATIFLSWVVYLGAWAWYGEAHSDLTFWEGILMCSLYTVAWIAGYLTFVTPSGLGVRELAFTSLAAGFPPSAVAYFLVLGRASLLAIDLILGLIFLRTAQGFRESE